MTKCITCGSWNSNYKYIFFSIIFLALYKLTVGFGYDANKNYSTRFLNNGKFSSNYMIHEVYLYIANIIIAFIMILIEKISIFSEKKQKQKENKENDVALSNESSHDGNINLIYRFEGEKYSKKFILYIIFLDVLLGQVSLIFSKFFTHINFWMIELYFVAYLYLKIFHIEIYKHKYLAFGINFISMVLILIKVILTIFEGDEKKALYVKFWWFIFIAIIIFSIYAYFLSYIFVNLKKIFYLKFIPVSRILLYYGIIGFILSVILCTFFSAITCGKKIENIHEVKDYICKVINYENQTFIDNAKVYFVENWENSETNEKRNEILISIIQSLLFSIYKYFSYKIIESLNPFHRIFSGSIYYFTEQMIFFLSNLNKIIQDENIYLKLKMYMDLSSDFLSVLTFLIYTEIIEINFCHFNYNLRKNIILRGKNDDSSEYDLDRSTINEDDTTINGVSDYNSNYSISST